MSLKENFPENLLEQYLQGTLNEADRKRLMDWFQGFDDEIIEITLNPDDQLGFEVNDAVRARLEIRIWERITERLGPLAGDEPNATQQEEEEKVLDQNVFEIDALSGRSKNKNLGRTLRRYGTVAAACLAVFFVMRYVLLREFSAGPQNPSIARSTGNGPIRPGHNGAILTLSNGSTVVLDSQKEGEVALQGGAKVLKNGDQLLYAPVKQLGTGSARIVYNTMTTPRGKQFSLVLPDGTKVWLNAASSITYPVHFAPDKRIVSVTGEVYFEVAHLVKAADKSRVPFEVQSGPVKVQVLGTHFEVKNYLDEAAVRTTLLEGSVRVHYGNSSRSVTIRPGQQASLNREAPENIKVQSVSMEHVFAWKSGLFRFEDDPLSEILKQVSRWYNVDVDCVAGKQQLRFNGVISKRAEVQDLLDLLSATGVVNFRVEKDRIYAY
ncbi:MAG TPA: FecR domain-containing protein [Arachidicoccus sp.]|nr:FecR domain-containing protein [Arachidicoccus sp.]